MLGMVHLTYMNVLNEYFLHKQKNALVYIHCYSGAWGSVVDKALRY